MSCLAPGAAIGSLLLAPVTAAGAATHRHTPVAHASDGAFDLTGHNLLPHDLVPVASFIALAGLPGSVTSLDASASTVSTGSITTYKWSFGDGTSAETATPKTTHVYLIPGAYTITLTEIASLTHELAGHPVTLSSASSAPASQPVVVPPVPKPAPPVPPVSTIAAAEPVTVTPSGDAQVPLSCPTTATAGCHGTVRITLDEPFASVRRGHVHAVESRCARGCRALGTATYQARAGHRVRVRVHMASFARGLLARRKHIRVTVTATTIVGNRVATNASVVVLHAPGRAAAKNGRSRSQGHARPGAHKRPGSAHKRPGGHSRVPSHTPVGARRRGGAHPLLHARSHAPSQPHPHGRTISHPGSRSPLHRPAVHGTHAIPHRSTEGHAPVKPATPAKPAAPVKPATPAKPAAPVKPATPAKPAAPAKPATPAKPAAPTKPATPAKPAAPTKRGAPAKR